MKNRFSSVWNEGDRLPSTVQPATEADGKGGVHTVYLVGRDPDGLFSVFPFQRVQGSSVAKISVKLGDGCGASLIS